MVLAFRRRARPYVNGLSAVELFRSEVEGAMRETMDALGLLYAPEGGRGRGLVASRRRVSDVPLRFFRLFVAIDADGSGEVSLDELYAYYGLSRSKLLDRLLGMFDLDRSEAFSFQEFVIALWNLCTQSRKRLLRFAMDIFDVDQLGTLDRFQLDALVRMVYAVEETPAALSAVVRQLVEPRDLDGLDVFLGKHPELLEPVTRAQDVLRRRTLGRDFWRARTQQRSDEFGELESAADILLRKRRARQAEQERAEAATPAGAAALQQEKSGRKSIVRVGPAGAGIGAGVSGGEAPGVPVTALGGKVRRGSAQGQNENENENENESENASQHQIQNQNQAGEPASGGARTAASAALSGADGAAALSEHEIYVLAGREMSVTQNKAVAASVEVSELARAMDACIARYRECEQDFMTTRADRASLPTTRVHQSSADFEAAVADAARLKQRLLRASFALAKHGAASLSEAERTEYLSCLRASESGAEQWFVTKDGKAYLKEMGREHAQRDVPEGATLLFGRLPRELLSKGEKKARLEYVARKAREEGKQIEARFAQLKERHVRRLERLFERFNLLSEEEEAVVPVWQWQKIPMDDGSERCFFYTPATQASLWAEPFLSNCGGVCEYGDCREDARARCITCAKEFCPDCDVVVHAYGPARNHRARGKIPAEEALWRDLVIQLPKAARGDVTRAICADPVELARRRLAEHERRDLALYGAVAGKDGAAGADRAEMKAKAGAGAESTGKAASGASAGGPKSGARAARHSVSAAATLR
jgi:hypothetical protein